MDLETLKSASPLIPLSVPFINAIVETYLKPKIAKLVKKNNADSQAIEHTFCNKFCDYLTNAAEKHKYLTVLVFNNEQKLLEDIYVPMKVICEKNQINIQIDDYKDEFIPKYKKVLITDSAGMGKSTLMKYLFMCSLKKNAGIPIFIDLRKLEKDKSIVDFITGELNSVDEEFDRDFIARLIKRGDFIFFLDGYDEIPFDQKSSITNNLQDFISKASANYFIMTSRPESSLTSFASFKGFKVQPLKEEEAFTLIRKYDAGRGVAQHLIEKLKEGNALKEIKEFLGNPLLVSLLYKSYEHKPTIPLKKHIFYRQVYDSLFEDHDLSKEGAFVRMKYSGLDIEDFHMVLRILGFVTVKAGKVEYGKDEIIDFIKTSKQQCPGLNFRESQLLNDLLQTVPLFVKDGSFYKWSHKSIQDYFAAQFICIDAKGKQEEILSKIYQSPSNEKFYNILDLCYDIDFKTFRSTIIYQLACDYIDYFDNSYQNIPYGVASSSEIDDRRALSFGMRIFLCSQKDSRKIAESGGYSTDTFKLLRQEGFLSDLSSMPDFFSPSYYSFSNRKSAFNSQGLAIVIALKSHIMPIINLLWKKNNEIVERKLCDIDYIYQGKTSVVLNDDAKSPANSKVNFVQVNTLLAGVRHSLVLNISKCRQIVSEIKKEKVKEKENDIFLKDI